MSLKVPESESYDASSSEEEDIDEEDHAAGDTILVQDQVNFSVQLTLRLHAASIPRYGIRKMLPDTFVRVSLVKLADCPNESTDRAFHVSETPHDHVLDCGRTEIVYKSTNPQYITTFPLTYVYGSKSFVSIDLFRLTDDKNRKPLRIGSSIYEIGDILGSKTQTKVKRLRDGGVIFCGLEMTNRSYLQGSLGTSCMCRGRFRFQFRASNLRFGKRHRTPSAMLGCQPDTVLQIQKRHINDSRQSWMTVYRSSPVYESISPTFDEGEIDLRCLCDGDLERPIRLSVWCHKKWSRDLLVGICETTAGAILRGKNDVRGPKGADSYPTVESIHHTFQLRRDMYKNKIVGKIDVISAKMLDFGLEVPFEVGVDIVTADSAGLANDSHTRHQASPLHKDMAVSLPPPIPPPTSFDEFMKGSFCKLDLTVAIDFTSSNGDPRQTGTLHYQNANNLNDYEETIVVVAGALVKYASTAYVYGFGAKYDGATRHIFQCGASAVGPSTDGVNGILRAYKSVFESDLVMSGPTVYDHVLQACAARARNGQAQEKRAKPFQYSILLIITDGMAQDMEETTRKLRMYSSVPMSVIFVGLGRADFSGMYRLRHTVEEISFRPNVSFMEFRKHQSDSLSLGMIALQNLPTQIRLYMEQNKIL